MNAISPMPARANSREVRVVEDNSAVSYLLDTARFEHMQRIASAMASASLIPKHLKGKDNDPSRVHAQTVGNCFLVVNQAVRWNMDPFAIAPETYEVGGKLGYSGKLVAAVVNARAGLSARLDYKFEGSGDNRKVIVSATFKGEAEPKVMELVLKDAKTDNFMWTKDPDQKLVYSGSIKWARRWCPEVVLGVLTEDDLERIAAERATDVTPRPRRSDYIATEARPELSVSSSVVATTETRDLSETGLGEAKFFLITLEGEELGYELYEDFIKDFRKEHAAAARNGGPAVSGFMESQNLEQLTASDREGLEWDTTEAHRPVRTEAKASAPAADKTAPEQGSMY
jgi:hypothetical protein